MNVDINAWSSSEGNKKSDQEHGVYSSDTYRKPDTKTSEIVFVYTIQGIPEEGHRCMRSTLYTDCSCPAPAVSNVDVSRLSRGAELVIGTQSIQIGSIGDPRSFSATRTRLCAVLVTSSHHPWMMKTSGRRTPNQCGMSNGIGFPPGSPTYVRRRVSTLSNVLSKPACTVRVSRRDHSWKRVCSSTRLR